MSRKKIPLNSKKIKFSITINPILFKKIDILEFNKSKYIEGLIYADLLSKKVIDNNSTIYST